MTRKSGAKLIIDAERELSFLKSDPDENELLSLDGSFEISKAVEADDGTIAIEGYLNSTEVDDDIDGDVVDPKAFEQDLKHFLRHPVIRREHKHPIGRVLKVEFRPEGPWFEGVVTHDAPGEQTRDMIKKKVLQGISARFTAKPTPDDIELLPKGKGRMRVKRARLVEVTVTDVPRNSSGHFKIKEPIRAAFQKSLGAEPVVHQKHGGNEMEFMKLIAQLLSEAGHKCNPEDQLSVMKSLGDLIAAGKGAAGLVMIAKALGKPESSTPDQLLQALQEATSRDGMISKSVHEEVVTQFATLQVDHLLLKNSDRITPANKEFAKSLASKDVKMFEQWLSTQPPVPTDQLPKDTSNRNTGGGTAFTLSETDLELAKSFGITDEAKFKTHVTLKPHELMSQLMGQPVSETPHDKVYAQLHTIPWQSSQSQSQ